MRSVQITKAGGPKVLRVVESPDLHAGSGEVCVKVEAAGVNFADVMARMGLYPDAPKTPCTVGYEVSGIVDEVGANGHGFAKGDRVVALTRFGGHADQVVVPTAQARKIPDAMSFHEAAALPVVYLTAFHMIRVVAGVRPGAKVLVHSAAGGVGLAAIQLLKMIDDVTIFGTASASKHDMLREAGLQHPIDYRTKDYATEIRALTKGRGVDVILDALGGPDWQKGYDLLAPAGHLVCFGFANMRSGTSRNLFHVVGQFFQVPKFSPMKLMDDNKAVSGVNVGHLWNEMDLLGGELDEILALYDAGKIKPRIDSTFPFDRAADAHARLEERKNVGKVLLTPT